MADQFDYEEYANQCDDQSQNGSLENNRDNRSQNGSDEELKNILGQNWQSKKQNKMFGEVYLYSKESEDDILNNKTREFAKVQHSLTSRTTIQDYTSAINTVIDLWKDIPVDQLENTLKIIMTRSTTYDKQASYFIKNFSFLVRIIAKIGQLESVVRYQPFLCQILNKKHGFYDMIFTSDIMAIIEEYVNDNYEYEQFLESLMEDRQSQKAKEQNKVVLLNFFHQYILRKCFKKNTQSLLINCFLISKSPTDHQKQLNFTTYEQYLTLTQDIYERMDKRDLEEYSNLIILIADFSLITLERHIFYLIQKLLSQSSSIDKKVLGFKMMSDIITISKQKPSLVHLVLNWIKQNHILQRFLCDSTHPRIIQKLQPIIKVMYENNLISLDFIHSMIKDSYHSEEILKIIQNMISYMELVHLHEVYDIVAALTDYQSNSFIQLLTTIISHPQLNAVNNKKKKIFVIQDQREMTEMEMPLESFAFEPELKKIEGLVLKIFQFMIDLVVMHQQIFIPLFIRFISSQIKIVKNCLENQILNLLRNHKSCSLWIIEHWFKLEMGKERGSQAFKFQFVARMVNDGLYEYILVLMAKNRFSKPIIQKILNVIILICRVYRPLEKHNLEFIWKVMGLTARDQKEREQFFVFLKQVLRFQNSLTEESVNYIFFQILLSLSAQWFSLRVYDCYEMLFMRLNEDCKLLMYENEQYEIGDANLIGIDKFWYIYFNASDLKVIKKCRDFIWKISTYKNSQKQEFLENISKTVLKHLKCSLYLNGDFQQTQKIVILRGIDMIDRMLEERQKKEECKDDDKITINITNNTEYCIGEKKKNLEVSLKTSLSELRSIINQNLNPPVGDIQLMTRGKILQGDNLNLKELAIENNQKFIVNSLRLESLLTHQQKQEKINQTVQKLTECIGECYPIELYKFAAQKYVGISDDKICQIFLDSNQLEVLNDDYLKAKEKIDEENPIGIYKEIKPKEAFGVDKNFAELITGDSQSIDLLLECLKFVGNDKKGWALIKKLPFNNYYSKLVLEHASKGNWRDLFFSKTKEHSLYFLNIISSFTWASTQNMNLVLQEKQIRPFMIDWITEIIDKDVQNINYYEEIFKFFILCLPSSAFTPFDAYLSKKRYQDEQSISKLVTSIIEDQIIYKSHINRRFCQLLVTTLSQNNVNEKIAHYIIKIYLHNLYYLPLSDIYSIVDQDPSRIYELLLNYGKAIQYAIIVTVLVLQNKVDQQREFSNQISKFTQLLFKCSKNNGNGNHEAYFRSLQLLIERLDNNISEAFASQSIKSIIELFSIRIISNEDQVVGYLRVFRAFLEKYLKNSLDILELENYLTDFADWLFNTYLFSLENSLPHFKSKVVRKAAYDLLHLLCQYDNIAQDILKFIINLKFDRRMPQQEDAEIRTAEFIGIRNLGATCYINSLLQQLYHTKFPKLLIDEDTSNSDHHIRLFELKKIFINLYCGSKSIVSTRDYVKQVKINGDSISPMIQQDANEYFTSLMNTIEEQVGTSAIYSIFKGTLYHEIKGLEEGTEEVKCNQQQFLTLMIEMKGKKNLQEALASLMKGHILEGENMYYSDTLNRKIRATSKTYIDQLPNILVITLKRFRWSFQTNSRHKINDYFEFPVELDLTKFANEGKDKNVESENDFKYQLCGILIHSGCAESGHYYSYIKVKDKWYEFNDRQVSEFNLEANLKNECFGGSQERSRNAYMLFYQKCDSASHGVFLHQLPTANKMIEIVRKDNETFVKNKLIYDANYVQFLKKVNSIQKSRKLTQILEILCPYQRNNLPQIPQYKQLREIQIEPIAPLTKIDSDISFEQKLHEQFYKNDQNTIGNNLEIKQLIDAINKKPDN